MSSVKPLDFILIGKTGNGKSASGNSILMKEKVFKSNYRSSSVTKKPQYEWSRFENYKIQVVDAPGVIDTHSKKDEDIKLITGAMEKAIIANPDGYHAFLVVVKFGTRFTEDEQKAIQILKGILGEDFLRNYGIIILSNGDDFKREQDENNLTLANFCEEEEGPFKELLNECSNRIVVFDNVTKKSDEKNEQVKNLVKMVDCLPSRGTRYTNGLFEKAALERKRMYITSKLPMIQKETFEAQSLILDEIKNSDFERNERKKVDLLSQLFPRIDVIINDLTKKDQGTGALKELLDNVKKTRNDVTNKIKHAKQIIEENEKMKALEEKIKKEAEQAILQKTQQLEKEREAGRKQMEEEMKKLELKLQLMAKEEADKERKKAEKGMKEQAKRIEEENKRREEEIRRHAKEEMDRQQALIEKEKAENKKRAKKEKEKLKRELAETEERYRQIKEEADKGFFTKLKDNVLGFFGF
ncbi:GTPase IMAP family member 7-like [Physella acuta]|uniref:GTPase IMAP family member 7-like n=1 Tax=Physella acuta TaxID=109671 RepID=UPI0027DC98AB|nr:GTPase IMAP family member 7-like [Physella acuta]